MSRLLNMNESSFSHVRYSKFGFFSQEVAIFRKNLKIDNFLFSIKHKTTQNKELKYRRKNIVCTAPCNLLADLDFIIVCMTL